MRSAIDRVDVECTIYSCSVLYPVLIWVTISGCAYITLYIWRQNCIIRVVNDIGSDLYFLISSIKRQPRDTLSNVPMEMQFTLCKVPSITLYRDYWWVLWIFLQDNMASLQRILLLVAVKFTLPQIYENSSDTVDLAYC